MSSVRSQQFFQASKRNWRGVLLGAVVLGQGLFAFLVGILIFYRGGAYFLDAGYYIHALASENFGQQPPGIGDAWGSSLYATHMLLTPLLISQFFRLIASAPLNFIMFLGIQHLILASAGALLMMVSFSLNGVKKKNLWMPGIVGALLLPFSNIGLGSLLYPHVELIGTSLVAIGILLLVLRWSGSNNRWIFVGAVAAIFFGLLTREDIGVHLGITVGSAVVCSQWKSLGREGVRRAGALLLAALFMTAMLVGYQRFFAQSEGVFALTYSGTPAYAHITSAWYLLDRVLHMLASRPDLIIGLAAFVMAAIVLRKREYLAFPLAVAPWLLLNLTAIDPAKNAMGIYHLFPIILYATAPVLALRLSPKKSADIETDAHRGTIPMYATYGVAVISLFLGGIAVPPLGGGFLFTTLLRLPLIGPSEIKATHSVIEEFASIGSRITVDDAVMSIRPVELGEVPLIPTVTETDAYDSALFFSPYLLGHVSVRSLIERWIVSNRQLTVTCLPAGMARIDAAPATEETTGQTVDGQFDRVLGCHPMPTR